MNDKFSILINKKLKKYNKKIKKISAKKNSILPLNQTMNLTKLKKVIWKK